MRYLKKIISKIFHWKEMEKNTVENPALLVHIEHKKPIEIKDFVSSLRALNNLYAGFIKNSDKYQGISNPKLFVEKIEDGCIDIFLCELATAALLPFMEYTNTIIEFAGYVKGVYDYFCRGRGEKPHLSIQECKDFASLLDTVVADNGSSISIGAVSKDNIKNVFNNCTFNFQDGNSTQNQMAKEIKERKEINKHESHRYNRVLMQIFQVRNDRNGDIGNYAIIDSVLKGKKMSVVFGTDELKNKILFSDFNPTQKAFWVDVIIETIENKPKAYNVVALHDIIDI